MNIFQINPLLSRLSQQLTKMATKVSMDVIKANANLTKETISVLKSELKVLNQEYNTIRAKQLREENTKLMVAVEAAKMRLVQVEIANGIPQIPLSCTKAATNKQEKEASNVATAQHKDVEAKGGEKPKKTVKVVEDAPVDVGRLDLRVAKVVEIKQHPNADTLYWLTIDCGDEKTRSVCSGLVKHIPMEQLMDRSVMLLCNLKPVKMRGITSEAMVMCASTADKVEVLQPPAGSAPGDLIDCDGFPRRPDAVMNPKKKIFETVAPDLHTNAQLHACYKGVPLNVIGKGHIVAQTLKNVPVK